MLSHILLRSRGYNLLSASLFMRILQIWIWLGTIKHMKFDLDWSGGRCHSLYFIQYPDKSNETVFVGNIKNGSRKMSCGDQGQTERFRNPFWQHSMTKKRQGTHANLFIITKKSVWSMGPAWTLLIHGLAWLRRRQANAQYFTTPSNWLLGTLWDE